METTFGERAADFVAYNIGRWAFVLTQTALMKKGGPEGPPSLGSPPDQDR